MNPRQIDLFGPREARQPEGLALVDALVSPAEEAALIAHIDQAGLSPFRFQGWTGKRLTASYGHGYDYDKGRLLEAEPVPQWLDSLRRRLAESFGFDPQRFVQALVIRYDPGAGIGWHRDRPQFEHVLGLSLGSSVALRMRRRMANGRFERCAIDLERRSAYCLTGPSRWDWQHEIQPVTETRWSVTLRSLRETAAR